MVPTTGEAAVAAAALRLFGQGTGAQVITVEDVVVPPVESVAEIDTVTVAPPTFVTTVTGATGIATLAPGAIERVE